MSSLTKKTKEAFPCYKSPQSLQLAGIKKNPTNKIIIKPPKLIRTPSEKFPSSERLREIDPKNQPVHDKSRKVPDSATILSIPRCIRMQKFEKNPNRAGNVSISISKTKLDFATFRQTGKNAVGEGTSNSGRSSWGCWKSATEKRKRNSKMKESRKHKNSYFQSVIECSRANRYNELDRTTKIIKERRKFKELSKKREEELKTLSNLLGISPAKTEQKGMTHRESASTSSTTPEKSKMAIYKLRQNSPVDLFHSVLNAGTKLLCSDLIQKAHQNSMQKPISNRQAQEVGKNKERIRNSTLPVDTASTSSYTRRYFSSSSHKVIPIEDAKSTSTKLVKESSYNRVRNLKRHSDNTFVAPRKLKRESLELSSNNADSSQDRELSRKKHRVDGQQETEPYSQKKNPDSGLQVKTTASTSQQEFEDIEMLDVSADLQSLPVVREGDDGCADTKSLYVVLDTNVLMHDLKLVDELKDIPLEGTGPPHVVIPWVVIQELDKLKSRTDKSKRKFLAVEAVKYLYNMLNTKHPRFHGQTAKMSAKSRQDYDNCNDDVVLGCCLQLAEKMPKEKIMLLSNDINLCNKAIITGITAHTVTTLKASLNNQIDAVHKSFLVTDFVEEPSSEKGIEKPIEKDLKKEVNFILCETKMLLKIAFEPFLEETMNEAFGDISKSFLPTKPAALCDILDCYNRFWVSAVGLKLPPECKQPLQRLAKNFNITKVDYSCDGPSLLITLKDAEIVCKAIREHTPAVDSSVRRLSVLIDQCKLILGCVEEKPEDEIRSVNASANNQIVLAVFNHLWALISHLCGLTLSFAEIPHDFVYTQPEEMPSLDEFQLLLSNLYPQVHKLRKSMKKLVDEMPDNNDNDFKLFYNYLLQFVPSLQIQATPPPTNEFNIEKLKMFFKNPENKELITNGVSQLNSFYAKLNECVRHSVWKQ